MTRSRFIAVFSLLILFAPAAYSQRAKTIVPKAPDYADATMWYTEDGDPDGTGADVFYVVSTWEEDWTDKRGRVSHYADVWNPEHREHMAFEMSSVASYMAPGNRFWAPFYRHTTMEAFLTRDENIIHERARLAMDDVCAAFDAFLQTRDSSRPLIIAGFSQGGMAVVELLKHIDDETYKKLAGAYVMGYKVTARDLAETKHIKAAEGASDLGVTICYNTVKDVKYVHSVIADTEFAINPVNWRTDATPAILHDTITVTLAPAYHVLVVTGYEGAEYKPYKDFINVGDLHSAEPWLYRECIQENMALRAAEWRRLKGPVKPYFTVDQLPDLIQCLPPPPDTVSAQFGYDMQRYMWGKTQRLDPVRAEIAKGDAIWGYQALLKQFSEAFGLEISPETTPEIWRLMETSLTTTDQMRVQPKAFYHRKRPFERFNEPTLTGEDDDLRGEGSYPSGHTMRGWSAAMLLAEINPAAANALFARGWMYGESRVIAGAHWQSDVDASRVAASIGVTALHTSPEFLAQMARAQEECRRLLAK